jgi:hypothetical protein
LGDFRPLAEVVDEGGGASLSGRGVWWDNRGVEAVKELVRADAGDG